jgi:hypothetical protein
VGAATSLTSLRLSWAEDTSLEYDDMEGFSEQLAKLKELCCLKLSCLPLRLSAHHLSHLTRLTSLELCSCELRDFVVVALSCKLKNLQRLSLDNNNALTDSCTPSLGQLTRLSHLNLHGMAIERLGLMQLTTLRQLQDLHISTRASSYKCLANFWSALRAGRDAVRA